MNDLIPRCTSNSVLLLAGSLLCLVGCSGDEEPEVDVTQVDVPDQGTSSDTGGTPAREMGMSSPDMDSVANPDPFDNTPSTVLAGLLHRSYDCYADESGTAESFLASIAFEQDDRLLVQDAEQQVHEGQVSSTGSGLAITVSALSFSESMAGGDYHLGELLGFQTASMTCHITSLDYRQDDSVAGYKCPTINHDPDVGYYEFNRVYFSSLQSGSVYRERLLEFTRIPDTQIQRRSGIYKKQGEVYYIGFGSQAGDDVILTAGVEQGSDVVIEGVSSIQKPCEPF